MAVNQFRISFCLLNRYVPLNASLDEKKIYRSRGLLLLDLADARSLTEAWDRASRFSLEEYPPFTLVALEPDAPALLLDWTGRRLFHQFSDEKLKLLVSSSYDHRGAEMARRDLFDRMRAEAGTSDTAWVDAFHSSHLPYRGAYSPCMHRADASTVSFSCVKVAGDHIEFSYSPGAPCEQKESIQRREEGKSSQTFILPTVVGLMEVR